MNFVACLTAIMFSISSSIDNFGVGITYGIRSIRIGFLANFIISIIAFVFSITGIYGGHFFSRVFPGSMSDIIASIFLVLIGIRIIFLSLPQKKKIVSVELKGESEKSHMTEYLSLPEKADLNRSGNINPIEATVLGVAVSMNALTNGLGAGLIGLSPVVISFSTAIFSYLSISFGVSLGKKVSNVKIGKFTIGQLSTLISGLILLLIALHVLI